MGIIFRYRVFSTHLVKQKAASALVLQQEDYKAYEGGLPTYCKGGESHAHASEAVESECNEDKNGEI